MGNVIYTENQQKLLDCFKEFIELSNNRVFILKGYAGTGKTTMLAPIANIAKEAGYEVVFMAPTGRAAKIIKSKTGCSSVSTIHKRIYSFERIVSDEETSMFYYEFILDKLYAKSCLIVDEASMVSSREMRGEMLKFGSGKVFDDILKYMSSEPESKIIFVGDPVQLPPVGDNISQALIEDSACFDGLGVSSCELTNVIRQDDGNYILKNATMLRNSFIANSSSMLTFYRSKGQFEEMSVSDVAREYVNHAIGEAVIVCYTNSRTSIYNGLIRSILFPNKVNVCKGDLLMVVCNSYNKDRELLNGEFVKVIDASDKIEIIEDYVYSKIDNVKKKVMLTFREVIIQDESGAVHNELIVDSLLCNSRPALGCDETKLLYINLCKRAAKDGINDKTSKEFYDFISKDKFYNALRVKYGYAITCHKSQGGEWDTVYIDFQGRNGMDRDTLRWKYTAITRAKSRVVCVGLDDQRCVSKVSGIVRIQAQQSDLNQIDVSDVDSILSSGEYEIVRLDRKPYRNIYYILNEGKESRLDIIYNKKGIVTEVMTTDTELENLIYSIHKDFNYKASVPILENIYSTLKELEDDYGFEITKVSEFNNGYSVHVYLSFNDDKYAILEMFLNKVGDVTFITPKSSSSDLDETLLSLVQSFIKEY